MFIIAEDDKCTRCLRKKKRNAYLDIELVAQIREHIKFFKQVIFLYCFSLDAYTTVHVQTQILANA